jgi:DNA-binding transcriptional MerR regulator
MNVSRQRLYVWLGMYNIKGQKKLIPDKEFSHILRPTFFFTDDQVKTIRRIHQLTSEKHPPREIRRILKGKPPSRKVKDKQVKPMKVDRELHPVLTQQDLEPFVSQLTELERSSLATLLQSTDKMYSKNTVYDFIDDISEAVDDIQQAVEQLEENHAKKPVQIAQLRTHIESLKSKLESFK